jgi:hypothetical protein
MNLPLMKNDITNNLGLQKPVEQKPASNSDKKSRAIADPAC